MEKEKEQKEEKKEERKDLYFPDGSKATESELIVFWQERIYLRNS